MASKLTKKEREFYKNKEFYLSNRWGSQIGYPDTSNKYTVRTIGPRQAVIENVAHASSSYRHGTTIFLSTEQQEEWARSRGNQNFIPTKWSHLLTPTGNEGWDPEWNF